MGDTVVRRFEESFNGRKELVFRDGREVWSFERGESSLLSKGRE